LIEIEYEPTATGERDSSEQPLQKKSSQEIKSDRITGDLPTDSCKTEAMMSMASYVTVLEDLLFRLQINVAVAKGFQALEFPDMNNDNNKKYIDLWPIQMSAEISAEGDTKQNILTTNFDTCKTYLEYMVRTNV
jgi:potassium/chloride transporter 9